MYHKNSQNSSVQGNRNPFIETLCLATRIWDGNSAEDRRGIYTSNDTEAPSEPTNITMSNINYSSFDVSWTASTDNEAETGYDVFVMINESVNDITLVGSRFKKEPVMML